MYHVIEGCIVGNYLSKSKEDNPCLKNSLCVKQIGITFERMGFFFQAGFHKMIPSGNATLDFKCISFINFSITVL